MLMLMGPWAMDNYPGGPGGAGSPLVIVHGTWPHEHGGVQWGQGPPWYLYMAHGPMSMGGPGGDRGQVQGMRIDKK